MGETTETSTHKSRGNTGKDGSEKSISDNR
jgi:hypothetical protein